MNGLALDLRLTLRSMRRTPGLFAVALLTIALGVGVNTAMFSIVNAVVLEPLPYPDPGRLVSLWPEKRWSLQMLRDVAERVGSYAATSAYRQGSYMLLGGQSPEAVPVAIVTPSHFAVLGAQPAAGRLLEPDDADAAAGPVVVLSHGFWQRQFGGDPAVVGRQIRLAGGGVETRTVVGVLAADFTPTPANADAWVPMVADAALPGYFGGYGMTVLGRLEPGVPVDRARAELRAQVTELTPMHPTQFRPVRYSPVDVLPLLDVVTRDVRPRLLVLLGAVGFVLLIACTNVATLLLARAHGHQRDVAIQVALGCAPSRITRQVLTESIVLGIGGGTAGLIGAALALPLLRNAVAEYVPRADAIGVDASVLLFAAVASVTTALVFGAIPALQAARSSPSEVMRATAGRGQSQGRAGRRTNDLFVAVEIALSLMLLAGAGLMLKSLWQLSRVDPGFDASSTLTFQVTLPPGRYDSLNARAALLARIEERLYASPDVDTVGAIDILPLSGAAFGVPYQVVGIESPPGTSQVVNIRIVTPAVFAALRVPLLRGRMLGAEDVPVDSAGEGALVVNEAFAQLHWPGGEALGGRLLSVDGTPLGRIVGIVRDVRQTALDAPPDPEIYAAASQWGWTGGYLVVRGTRGVPLQSAITAAVRAVEPDLGIRNVMPMTEVLRAAADDTRFYTRLLIGFAALALVLGLVGVYGVMTYAASRRTREFGVRLAFGATRRDLILSVVGRAMVPVAGGVALGIVGALALTRLIGALLYDVQATDPWVLGGVALLLTASAAAAALIPAARTSRLSPGVVLLRD